tara:strand:+ start:3896 stop:4072 length:177 start_codon:yes stop_codon:yes gene_type:complete
MKNVPAKIALTLVAIVSLTITLEAITIGIQGIISMIAIVFIIYLSWGKLSETPSVQSK